MASSTTSSGGIGILGVVGIVFVILKLVGVINWSWWWVLAPFWINLIFILPFIGFWLWALWITKKSKTKKRK